jgi:sugar phosphate isomerase/epimerase
LQIVIKKIFIKFALFILLTIQLSSCSEIDEREMKKSIFDKNNLFAWCIVPFDSMKRTPDQRIEMLKDLGFNSYAYDWRENNLSETEYEFNLASENNIEIKAVWMWIDADADSIGHLSDNNETLLRIVEKTKLETTIWLGFHENFYENLNERKSVEKVAGMIQFINQKAAAIGCRLAFYNHGGWLGDPKNQIEIIKYMGIDNIGIVYNFHHGHEQIDQFPHLLQSMMPYLTAVNINGMNRNGPKILTVGAGEMDKTMIKELYESDFKGPVGIICHREDSDAKKVLSENLEGLNKIIEGMTSNNSY